MEQQPIGLANLGNTCFMNTILQCLFNSKWSMVLLRESVTGDGNNNYQISIDPKSTVTNAYVRLFHNNLTSKNMNLDPSDFLRTFHQKARSNKMAIGLTPIGMQKDAHEFLISLLDLIHEEIKEKKQFIRTDTDNTLYTQVTDAYTRYYKDGFSLLVPWIHGMYMSTVTCSVCGKESNTFDPFVGLTLELSLKLDHIPTLEECLDNHFKTEILDKDNDIKCEAHKGHETSKKSTKKMLIWQPPEVLIFSIKRFGTTVQGGSLVSYKNNVPILFPEKINMDNYIYNSQNDVYTLSSVGNHHGKSLPSGHYTATITKHNKWWNISDSSVTETHHPFNTKNTAAYVLIYSKS